MSEIRVTHREKDEAEIRAGRDQYGNLGYWVGVSIDGVEQRKGVLVKHKGDRDIMNVGDTFDQHGFVGIETKKSSGGAEYFKAVRPAANVIASNGSNTGGYNGTSRDLSPEAQARIDATGRAQGRAHAQEMALRYAQIKAQLGQLPADLKPQTLVPIVEFFYNDAQAAKERKPA